MGDVINLNQARKAREKRQRERQAVANRSKFGRDKTERQRAADDQGKMKKELDGKALSPQPAPSLATPLEKDSEPKA